jgi:O-antigen/teichoic acid export membrane protein
VLIRQTLAYMPAQLISSGTQFATAIILTHFLSVQDYGLTMLMIASQELAYLICLSWWSGYLMRYYGALESEAQRARFHAAETTVVLVASLLQILVMSVVILLTEPTLPPAFYASACAFALSRSFLMVLTERARITGAIFDYSVIQIVSPVGSLVLALFGMAYFGKDPGLILLAFALIQGLVGLGIAWRLKVVTSWPGRDAAIFRSALIFGFPLIVGGAFGWLAGNGIRLVVDFLRGAVELGLLSVGWGLAARLASVAAQFLTAAAYPLAVRAMQEGDPASARAQISQNCALLFGILAPMTFGVIAIGEPLIRWLVAAEFQAVTIELLPWALVATSLRSLRVHGWDQTYLLFEKPRAMMIMEGIEGILTLIGAAIGLVFYGLLGAVLGVGIVTALIAIGDWLYLRQSLKLDVPFFKLARILVASLIMFGALYLLPRLGLTLNPDGWSLFRGVFIGMAIYGLALLALFPEIVRGLRAKILRS